MLFSCPDRLHLLTYLCYPSGHTVKRRANTAELSGSADGKEKTDRPAAKRPRKSPETELAGPHVAGPSSAARRSLRSYSLRNRALNLSRSRGREEHEGSPTPEPSGNAGPSK